MNERQNLVIEGPDSPLKEWVLRHYQHKLGWKIVNVKEKIKNEKRSYDDIYRNETNSILVSTHLSASAESLFWFGKQPFEFDEKKSYDRTLQENACVILVIPHANEFTPTEWKYSTDPFAETRRFFLVYWTEMNGLSFHSIQNSHTGEWDKIISTGKKVVCEERETIKILA